MTFSKKYVELSQRAGKIFGILDEKIANEIRPIIINSKSFDDLPKYVQQIIIDAEKKVKENKSIF